jgi:hypothetical protein
MVAAAAIMGSAAIGAVASSSASSKAENAANRATDSAAASADSSLQLGREQLDFTKQQYADAAPYREAAAKTSQQVSEAQLAAMQQATADAADYSTYNKTTFRPLEQGIVADAQGYDTPERRQAAADASIADVNSGFAGAHEASARRLASMGINPGSVRAMSAMDGQDVDQARASASAAYTARKGVETTGFARQMDAASLGRNLPSSQATSAGLSINAGNSSVSNAMNGITAVNSGVGGVQAGYSGAIGATVGAGGLYNSIAGINTNIANNNANTWAALGSAAGRIGSNVYGGSGTGAWNGTDFTGTSDRNLKTDIAPMSDNDALKAVAATPVSKWKYGPAKMAEAGIPMTPEDHGTQVGPMAQDVQKTMGEGAAPGGKKINLVTMNGINMKAVQAVNKKVDGLGKEVKSLAAMIRSGGIEARTAA